MLRSGGCSRGPLASSTRAIPIAKGTYAGEVSPGDKKVQILATREKANPTEEDLKAKETMGMLPRESFIPEEYNARSTLTCTVASGENKFDFALPLNP